MNECSKKTRYKCLVCGYVFDPEIGDIKGNVPKNTNFDQLPEEWRCPICRAHKDKFRRVERRCCG